jgi:hypothetical protein
VSPTLETECVTSTAHYLRSAVEKSATEAAG